MQGCTSERRRYAATARMVLGIAASMIAASASAHTGTGLAGGFTSGFSHPLLGLDHLLAMVLVGMWGAILGRPLIVLLPMLFPFVMVIGAAIGMAGVSLPSVEAGIAVSVIVLGACVAIPLKVPVWIASIIVATFAIFHGYAHGRELPPAADPIGYSCGFVFATGLLHVAGIGIGFLTRWRAGAALARSAGGVACMCGLWFLFKAIAA